VVGDFRTKDGRCIVAEDRLRIEIGKRGPLGTLRAALTDESIPPVRRAGVALFAVAVLVGVALAVRTLPVWLSGAGAGLLLAWLAWTVYQRRQRAATEVEIPFADVEAIEPQYGLPLLTRPRFVVSYRSEGGVKRRYVLCPSRLYGFGAYEHAKALFAERGLLTAEADTAVDSE
jgi:hypothetical protein